MYNNQFLHTDVIRDAADMMSWAAGYLSEFQNTQTALARNVNLQAKQFGHQFIGVGGVIRDGRGKIIASVSKAVDGLFSAEIGEFILYGSSRRFINCYRLKGWFS
ncbi:hypothetical protein QYF36_014117 [Acer negundo]|nr:hypothetical protein QYF36_014117 [Acer negundo]